MNRRLALVAAIVLASFGTAEAQLAVVSTSPDLNESVPAGATVSVEFDRPLNTATITSDSFRVFGRGSGTATGSFSFSNADRTVMLTPDEPFSAGEFVFVNLSHDIEGADASSFRAEGYAFQFMIDTASSAATFTEIDTFTNKIGGAQTRIYGAAATDLNNDEYLDLATVNEVSADVRVFLNLADGSGLYGSMLTPEPIGTEASPNEPADFDNDGLTDLCVGAAISDEVNVLLGAGDGSFSSTQDISVGDQPHGVAPLDVDGDGDLDIVNANVGDDNLSLMINNGNGVFGAPSYFEGGVDGEYGLTQADMDGDGITDLVVAGRDGSEIVTQLGNGDGTFSAAGPAQSTGGSTWVVVVGDVNGDGDLDAVTANDGSGSIGVLIGNGDGTFAAVDTISIGAHVPSVDLGDLDGDNDLDMVVSSYGGQFWRRFENDGTGSFSSVEDISAPSNPSCSILVDFDNDGDLDMALTDEIADVIVLMRNGSGGGPTTTCSTAPSSCREPTVAGKAKLQLLDRFPSEKDRLVFSWTKGEATTKAEFGDPLTSDGYELCLYKDGMLVQGFQATAGGTCDGDACWKETTKGYSYRDRDLTPDGVLTQKLTEGLLDGQAKIKVVGKGVNLDMPDLSELGGVLEVQLQKTTDALCWGARFTEPFQKHDDGTLKAISDAPDPNAPGPVWSEIHGQVLGPVCAGCHGGSGGLSGLGDCDTAYANLVSVASTELPSMNRIEPGDATTSWLMHKLDGTHGTFPCSGGFCGSQMPLGGPFLSMVTRDAIRAWINNGAVNDCW